eukprot:TRINITY_DN3932_c0_g1_i1.p1 TRINITY_DN3932_c0_g1~~TRINITY_DN3932_c0_g1_i1.p1  ORF type:complete len:458 (-),score=95.25 TRINITY_DN3932_c0_g1_i1:113-1486(-)
MNLLKSITSSFSTKTEEKRVEDSASKLKVESPEGSEGSNQSSNAEFDKARGDSLWKVLSGKMGTDIMDVVGLSLPIWLFEPTSALQRMAEMLTFGEILNESAKFANPLDRMAYVGVFLATGYAGTERYGKPFNPILGETFEFLDERVGYRFFSEQISHHPPIAACHASNEHFEYWQESKPKTKFNGNSADLDPCSSTHIYFPKTRDHFVLQSTPTSRIQNLILGRIWIDHFGTMKITNLHTGDSCSIEFERCGWLSRGRYEISGSVRDASGRETHQIAGKWQSAITVKYLYEDGAQAKGSVQTVWKCPDPNYFGKFNLTEFVERLNQYDKDYEELLPTSDSRLRGDRRNLSNGDATAAAASKHKLEELQRSDRRNRVAEGKEWTPRWFKEIPREEGDGKIWVYCGDYWERRSKKLEEIKQRKLAAKEKEASEPFFPPAVDPLSEGIASLACDFKSQM